MAAPTIFFRLDGATQEQAERCRQIVNTMFTNDAFNVRNGHVTLHFGNEGHLEGIDIELNQYRRNKNYPPLATLYKNDKLEVTT